MTEIKKYTTAPGMRMALEERLKHMSKNTGSPIERLRRQVAFDRFLARIFSRGMANLIVKGGYILELRLDQARTTKDIDFSFTGNLGGIWTGKPEELQSFLYTYAQINLKDFFEYTVGPATLDLDNAPYGGYRFPIEARMAGRRFEAFSIDIAAGGAWFAPHEYLPVHDWFDFAEIPSVEIPVISIEQQFTEKLHSYTQPRENANSRVKDLIDMVLLIKQTNMSEEKIQKIARITFSKRDDQVFPPVFENAPESWRKRYPDLAATCLLHEPLDEAIGLVRRYCKSIGIIQ